MDESDRSSALAGDNEGIGLIVLITPADPALNLVLGGIVHVLGAFHLHSLSQLLVVKLLLRHVDVVASEILDPEPNSAQLDGVKFFDFVVVLAVLIFQRSSDEPEPVNRLLFLLLGANGVIQEIALYGSKISIWLKTYHHPSSAGTGSSHLGARRC